MMTAIKPLESLGLALVYLAAGKLGLAFAAPNENVTAVWPPTGLALAVLVLRGSGLWPGVFLGAFLVNLTTWMDFHLARKRLEG